MDVMRTYESWLTMFKDDEKLVKELKSIADKPKEIEDRFYQELSFGTAGMRGVLGFGTNRMNIYMYAVQPRVCGISQGRPANAEKGRSDSL